MRRILGERDKIIAVIPIPYIRGELENRKCWARLRMYSTSSPSPGSTSVLGYDIKVYVFSYFVHILTFLYINLFDGIRTRKFYIIKKKLDYSFTY